MPFTDALMVAAICAAFIVFAAVLAWGERQTRHPSDLPSAKAKPEYGPTREIRAKSVNEDLDAAAN